MNDSMVVLVECPSGKEAISGAFTLSPQTTIPQFEGYDKFLFRTSQRFNSNTWQFIWRNMDSVGHHFKGVARAACATVE